MIDQSDILDPQAMAALMDCEPSTVEDKLRSGQLPGIKPGRSWICPRSALMQALHDQAMKNLEAKESRGLVVSISTNKPKRKTPPVVPAFKGN